MNQGEEGDQGEDSLNVVWSAFLSFCSVPAIWECYE